EKLHFTCLGSRSLGSSSLQETTRAIEDRPEAGSLRARPREPDDRDQNLGRIVVTAAIRRSQNRGAAGSLPHRKECHVASRQRIALRGCRRKRPSRNKPTETIPSAILST